MSCHALRLARKGVLEFSNRPARGEESASILSLRPCARFARERAVTSRRPQWCSRRTRKAISWRLFAQRTDRADPVSPRQPRASARSQAAAVLNLQATNSPRAGFVHVCSRNKTRPGLYARGQVHSHPGDALYLSGVQAPECVSAANAADARSRGRSQHRGVHFRLSRLAARRLRSGVVEGGEAPQGLGHRIPGHRDQRRPRCDHGLGHAAGEPVSGREIRRRVFDVVRQGPRRGSFGRRVQARQCRGHLEEWRRARARGRRSRLPFVDSAARLGARIRQRDDADPQSCRGAGYSRHGHARLGDEPLHRALGRLQDDRGNGGIVGLGQCQSAPARYRTADRFHPADGRPQHPLAGSAAESGNASAQVRSAGRVCVRACEPHRPRGDRFAAPAPRHRHHRQELSRRAAGARISRHRRRSREPISASAYTRSA